jgi:Potassium-transporting ATPase A subunit
MNKVGILQAGLFLAVVFVCVKPVGTYLECVFERKQTFLDPLLLSFERLLHRLVGINPKAEMAARRLVCGIFHGHGRDGMPSRGYWFVARCDVGNATSADNFVGEYYRRSNQRFGSSRLSLIDRVAHRRGNDLIFDSIRAGAKHCCPRAWRRSPGWQARVNLLR